VLEWEPILILCCSSEMALRAKRAPDHSLGVDPLLWIAVGRLSMYPEESRSEACALARNRVTSDLPEGLANTAKGYSATADALGAGSTPVGS
jgi:hypothetical protein